MTIRGTGGKSGQALVELALTSVLLILVVFGAVDFARLYNANTALQEAARVAARHAAIYDPNGNINPFLCDTTSVANGCPSPLSAQTFTSTDGIQQVVDRVLAGAGLPASTLQAGASCPGSSSPYNGPFTAQFSAMGNNYNQPWLYICYNTSTGSPGTRPSPPPCSPLPTGCGGYDIEVIVLMKFPLVIAGEVGPAVDIVGSSHMRVQST